MTAPTLLDRALVRLEERQEFLVVNGSNGRFDELKVYKPLAALLEAAEKIAYQAPNSDLDKALVAMIQAINGE